VGSERRIFASTRSV